MIHADWGNCAYHAVELQEDDYAEDLVHDNILEPIINKFKTMMQKMAKVIATAMTLPY
jgi:hypothetical protein